MLQLPKISGSSIVLMSILCYFTSDLSRNINYVGPLFSMAINALNAFL